MTTGVGSLQATAGGHGTRPGLAAIAYAARVMQTRATPPEPVPDAMNDTLPAGALHLPGLACAWRGYVRGMPAEPLVTDWLETHLPPAAPALYRDPYGRPRWPDGFAHDVSWSHSGGGLLMALGTGVRLGCDLEWLRPRPRTQELARRFFHPREADRLDRLPDAEREHAFVRLWCAKEAVLKAHGRGLAFGLHLLEFAPDAHGGLALIDCDPALGRPADWTLHAFAPAPGYLATLAWSPRPGPTTGSGLE